jgi:hypothetical protein
VTDSVFEVPYAESVRMLTQQASALDNLRSRASTILAAAALVTTFLGAQALATFKLACILTVAETALWLINLESIS